MSENTAADGRRLGAARVCSFKFSFPQTKKNTIFVPLKIRDCQNDQ